MAFQIKTKIKGHTYVYEVASHWDSQKKSSRQKRRLLGKWDEQTAQVVPTRSAIINQVKASFSYGVVYFLNELVKQLGIGNILRKSFPTYNLPELGTTFL